MWHIEPSKIVDTIEAFITNPWVDLAIACLLVVIAYLMNQSWVHWLILFSWTVMVLSVFRMQPNQELVARFLWTMLFAALVGLLLYYTLWIRKNPVPIAGKSPAPPSQSTSSPINQSPSSVPFNSGFNAGIVVKNTKDLQAFGNVFENVGALADVEGSEDIQIFNNRVTNQPPNPKSDSESQSKPELQGAWKTLYFARTLPTTPGAPEKRGIIGLGSLIGVRLRLVNNGTPSTAANFRLVIRSSSLTETMNPFNVSDGVIDGFNLRNEKRNIVTVIHESDTMVAKAMNPITKDQPVEGWLLYFLPKIDYRTFGKKTELEISFTDRMGQEYKVQIPSRSWSK